MDAAAGNNGCPGGWLGSMTSSSSTRNAFIRLFRRPYVSVSVPLLFWSVYEVSLTMHRVQIYDVGIQRICTLHSWRVLFGYNPRCSSSVIYDTGPTTCGVL